MMKRPIPLFFLAILLVPFFLCSAFLGCGKKPEQRKGQAQEQKDAYADKIQSQLDKMAYSGFGYKQIRPPKKIREDWKQENLEILKGIALNLKEGYVLELRGHTDNQESRKREITISNWGLGRLRSQFLFKLLKAGSLPSEKIVFTSVGDQECLDNVASSDAKNRRVTLHIKKK